MRGLPHDHSGRRQWHRPEYSRHLRQAAWPSADLPVFGCAEERSRRLGLGQPFQVAEIAQGLCAGRSEEHTSELQSLMHISYAVFCLKKKNETQSKQTK